MILDLLLPIAHGPSKSSPSSPPHPPHPIGLNNSLNGGGGSEEGQEDERIDRCTRIARHCAQPNGHVTLRRSGQKRSVGGMWDKSCFINVLAGRRRRSGDGCDMGESVTKIIKHIILLFRPIRMKGQMAKNLDLVETHTNNEWEWEI